MRLLSILLLLSFTISCKPQKLPPEELIISLEKTPCLGTCEVYKLEIFSSGLTKFSGLSNHRMIGNYTGYIKPEELNKIIMQFRNNNFFDFKDQYTGKMKDLPTTYLYFKDQSREKTIQDYFDAPKQLKELEQVVENLIPILQWKKAD